MSKLLLVVLFCFKISNGYSKLLQNDSSLFLNGVYLQNKKLLIPWEINFTKIAEYGSPKIYNKGRILSCGKIISWENVTILNNFKVNLFLVEFNRKLKGNKISRIYSFRAFLDSFSCIEMTLYFEKYSGKKSILVKHGGQIYYKWEINNTRIRIGLYKKNRYFLTIEKN